MRTFRTRLIAVAAALLLQQAAGMALVAALACCAGTSAPAAMECCRKGGSDHICPVTPRDGQRPAPCRMKSACTRDHAAGPAAPFFAWAAPLPDLLTLAAPPLHLAARDESSSRPLRADRPPPGPPPKS